MQKSDLTDETTRMPRSYSLRFEATSLPAFGLLASLFPVGRGTSGLVASSIVPFENTGSLRTSS